jgi:hypothetical protein
MDFYRVMRHVRGSPERIAAAQITSMMMRSVRIAMMATITMAILRTPIEP